MRAQGLGSEVSKVGVGDGAQLSPWAPSFLFFFSFSWCRWAADLPQLIPRQISCMGPNSKEGRLGVAHWLELQGQQNQIQCLPINLGFSLLPSPVSLCLTQLCVSRGEARRCHADKESTKTLIKNKPVVPWRSQPCHLALPVNTRQRLDEMDQLAAAS